MGRVVVKYKFEYQLNPLSPNPQMFKHIKKIRRLSPANCLSVFDHFVGLGLKGLNIKL